MEEWQSYKLGDLYEVHNGLSKSAEYFGSGFPFLSFSAVFKNYFLPERLDSLVESNDKEKQSFSIHRGDVFITRTSETAKDLGMSSVALKTYPGATFNGFTKRLRPIHGEHLVLPEFIGYYLRSPKFRSSFYALTSSMSTRASLANGDLLEMEVMLPSISEQKRISRILLSLDSKIALNNRINHNLEEQAQALFKSWFVDFVPFKDCNFVDSELGLIPDGWSVKTLGEVTKEMRDKVGVRQDVKVLSPITTGHLVLSEELFTKQVFSENIAKYLIVRPGDFAYNPARVNIGSLGLNEYPFDGCVSPVYVVFRCENGYNHFFNLYRATAPFKDEVLSRSSGGVRQTLGFKDFALIKLVYPPKEVIELFNSLYEGLIAVQKRNLEENDVLSLQRGSLLPRLMSGKNQYAE